MFQPNPLVRSVSIKGLLAKILILNKKESQRKKIPMSTASLSR